ncbi:hypothetical protein FRB91_011137 [Serendipita sp. 411]|nr:hypothetical protein FRB91_011137 [Serendipita sp. 411]
MEVDISLDYSPGEVRNHHRFYVTTGGVVIEIEKALFKIHRHFLTQYSPTLEGLFQLPQEKESPRMGEQSISIKGDSYRGWEVLLGLFYRDNHLEPASTSWYDAMMLLPVAHKYCMEAIETSILEWINKASKSKAQIIELINVTKALDMYDSFEKAVKELADARWELTFEDAQEMGLFAFYMVTRIYSNCCLECRKPSRSVCFQCRKAMRSVARLRDNNSWRI